MASLNRLLLLTSAYPAATGDAAFIRNEIAALAASFDEVLVYNTPRYAAGPFLPLPPNVRYAGSLDAGSLRANLRHLRSWQNLRTLWHILAAEHRAGRLRGHLATEWKVALSAINRRSQLDLSHPNTTVYAFWGAGSGLTLAALGTPASRQKRGTGVPRVVVRLHSYDLYEHLTARLPLRASLLGSADTILMISEHGRRHLENTWPQLIDPSRVHISRLGTPDSIPAGQPAAALSQVSARPSPSGNGIHVVSCSAINSVKRVHRIYDALVHLARTLPAGWGPVRWTHLGDGPLRADLEEHMARVASSSSQNLAGLLHTTFTGQVPPEEVVKYYLRDQPDVFINLSSREGVPVSVMEALSADIPVVATDVGGTSEIVGWDDGSGVLVDPDATPQQVAQALWQIVDHRNALHPRQVWQERCHAPTLSARAAALVRGAQVGSHE